MVVAQYRPICHLEINGHTRNVRDTACHLADTNLLNLLLDMELVSQWATKDGVPAFPFFSRRTAKEE